MQRAPWRRETNQRNPKERKEKLLKSLLKRTKPGPAPRHCTVPATPSPQRTATHYNTLQHTDAQNAVIRPTIVCPSDLSALIRYIASILFLSLSLAFSFSLPLSLASSLSLIVGVLVTCAIYTQGQLHACAGVYVR